ncbi:MAG: anaerobic ribonucleoside-triphosphate reductase activating protein [Lachnospiraceae bacterium]
MRIQGLQKLTLLDYPGKVACTIFTGGCNFRCPFCHNASLVVEPDRNQEIQEEEVLGFLKKRVGVLDGVCVSGGEPLLQPDIQEFLGAIKALGYEVKLDTNGSFPTKLKSLVDKGLVDYVAMDIKNSKEHYGKTIGLESYDLSPVEESVDFLLSGAVPYEFRTTVVREFHKKEDFVSIGKWLIGAKQYFLQGFVDSGDLIQPGLSGYAVEQMEAAKRIIKETVEETHVRGI